LITLVSGQWFACGVKNQPQPPQDVRPEKVTDMSATSVPDGVRLAWTRPDRYTGGKRMRDLALFVVSRAEGSSDFSPLARIPVTDREKFQRQRRVTYVDNTAEMGKYYRYIVVSGTDDSYESEPSNEATITRSEPSPTPNPENFALPTPTMVP